MDFDGSDIYAIISIAFEVISEFCVLIKNKWDEIVKYINTIHGIKFKINMITVSERDITKELDETFKLISKVK